jgi:hypothetical protein
MGVEDVPANMSPGCILDQSITRSSRNRSRTRAYFWSTPCSSYPRSAVLQLTLITPLFWLCQNQRHGLPFAHTGPSPPQQVNSLPQLYDADQCFTCGSSAQTACGMQLVVGKVTDAVTVDATEPDGWSQAKFVLATSLVKLGCKAT